MELRVLFSLMLIIVFSIDDPRFHKKETSYQETARCAREVRSSGADGQGVVENVAGVPAGLDLFQSWVIGLVVQRVPGDAGSIPLRIGKVDIRMVAVYDVVRIEARWAEGARPE